MEKYAELVQRVAALSLRERLLVLLSLCALIVALFYIPLIDPFMSADRKLARQVEQQRSLIAANTAQLEKIESNLLLDPVTVIHEDLKALKEERAQLREELSEGGLNVVPAKKVNLYVEQVLAAAQKLQVLDFSLQNTAFQLIEEDEPVDSERIFKQQIRLSVLGDEQALLRYLRHLEKMPNALGWDNLVYSASDAQEGVFDIKFHFYSVAQH